MTNRHVLHVFNPEHDLVLARKTGSYTAPDAARGLRADIGFLPALWAGEGDFVAVHDVCNAVKAFSRFADVVSDILGVDIHRRVEFVPLAGLRHLSVDEIDVWGWDRGVRKELSACGVSEALLPDDGCLDAIRELSHRRNAVAFLASTDIPGTVGEAVGCTGEAMVCDCIGRYRDAVLKAPWSCSGRGLRFAAAGEMSGHLHGWIRNIIKTQGRVMVEKRYDKVCDFGMEFYSDGKGGVTYCGLSLFSTDNGAYTGNIIASEYFKKCQLKRYVSGMLLDDIRESIVCWCGHKYNNMYRGFFGVDMMIVWDDGDAAFKVHPCVEINLRRTMGHAALSLTPAEDTGRRATMAITKKDKYQLNINIL